MMRVLVLSPYPERLQAAIERSDEAIAHDGPISAAWLAERAIDFIVSYGHRHIIRADSLRAVGGRAVNLHISYLPWNRGSDPNVWSFVEGTPKGVSIHQIDEGLDTGAILARREVRFGEGETLATSYALLQRTVEALFADLWSAIRAGRITPVAQELGSGSSHKLADRTKLAALLSRGWDTTIDDVEAFGRENNLFKTNE